MTVLLDTSVIIDALRGKMDRRNLLLKLSENGCILACCAINVAEVYAGARPDEEQDTLKFFQGLECIEIDWEVAQRAGALKYEWARKGKTIDLPDVIIAAAALAFDLTLATDNRKDFPMPDLKFLDLP
ncbi:MAG TPA: type II toxin-antitoxin system VapC family toxin [Candidatus Acidoferrum sp.]|nr:type II toxin-antitoxin system VapC family toxin [Candidatus Acidoferrum sp.]